MAAGGGGGLGALLTMVGSTDGATQLAALAAFGHVCAHPANTAALVRARALDRLFTFIGGSAAAELQTVALGGVAALCEHAAVSEGEPDERRLLPTLLSIARGSLTQRGSPPMRRDTLRALGALCGQRPLQRALIEGEGLPPSLLQICAAAAHVAEQKAALLALLRLLRVPHARARSSLLTSPRTRARCGAAAVGGCHRPLRRRRRARVPRRRLRIHARRRPAAARFVGVVGRGGGEGVAAAAAARSAVAVQALAARAPPPPPPPTAVRRRRMAAGRRRPSGRARSGSWWARRSR